MEDTEEAGEGVPLLSIGTSGVSGEILLPSLGMAGLPVGDAASPLFALSFFDLRPKREKPFSFVAVSASAASVALASVPDTLASIGRMPLFLADERSAALSLAAEGLSFFLVRQRMAIGRETAAPTAKDTKAVTKTGISLNVWNIRDTSQLLPILKPAKRATKVAAAIVMIKIAILSSTICAHCSIKSYICAIMGEVIV